MPLKLKIAVDENTTVLVWNLCEDIDYFILGLALPSNARESLEGMSKKRKIEWLSTRYLLKLTLKDFELSQFKKDAYGKPYLESKDKFISISHSHDFAAIIVSDKVVGIDIQKLHQNIERIAHKFISDKEMLYTQNEDKILHMHINWGAKESMYKGYGKKKLDFIKHMSILPYDLDAGTTSFSGIVSKNDITQHYKLFTKTIDEYVLVYAIQN
jgi:phosphopantetheinyl transferase